MAQGAYILLCMEESGRHLISPSATHITGSNNSHHHFHLPHLGKMHSPMHLHMPLPHFQMHSHSKKVGGHETRPDVPKGCVAVYVGKEGEEQQRFVVPVEHVNHPLFQKLLKEAEEEYGFERKGTIIIPCHVSHFQRVHDVIDRDQHDSHGHGSCFH